MAPGVFGRSEAIGPLEVPNEMADARYSDAGGNFLDAEKRGFEKMLRPLQAQFLAIARERSPGFQLANGQAKDAQTARSRSVLPCDEGSFS